MTKLEKIETHPVQAAGRLNQQSRINTKVTLAAYEVYCHIFAPQPSIITGSCRGGFGAGELMCFLYARSFPKDEWAKRFDEALNGMVNL